MPTIDHAAGLIIKKIDYSNTSVIFHLLTPKGIVHILARSAKNRKSQFAGKLEFFQIIHCHYMKTGSSDLYTLKECSYIDELRHMKDDIRLFFIGSFMLEVVSAVPFDDHDASSVYHLLVDACTGCKTVDADSYGSILAWFLARLLMLVGYAPDTSCCVVTKKPFRERVHPVLHPHIGFSNIPPHDHHSKQQSPEPIDKKSIDLFSHIADCHELPSISGTCDGRTAGEIIHALTYFITTLTGRHLKTLKTVQPYLR